MATDSDVDKDGGNEAALRVIVTDDDPLVRRLITITLRHAGITVIAEAESGREGVELALFYQPDVVLMDYMMPGMDGVEATRRIHAHEPAIAVIMFTSLDDDELALRALGAGAAGYLSKDIELAALPRVLRGVADGEAAIPRRLATKLIERYRNAPRGACGLRPVRSALTDREWEVLDLVATGASTEAIAESLVLSSETIRSHLKSVYRKLGVSSRVAAVKAAEQMRVLAGLSA